MVSRECPFSRESLRLARGIRIPRSPSGTTLWHSRNAVVLTGKRVRLRRLGDFPLLRDVRGSTAESFASTEPATQSQLQDHREPTSSAVSQSMITASEIICCEVPWICRWHRFRGADTCRSGICKVAQGGTASHGCFVSLPKRGSPARHSRQGQALSENS